MRFMPPLVAFAAAVAPALAMAQQQGDDSTIYDNWLYSCDQGACQASLSMRDDKSGETMFNWSFVYDTEKDQLSTIVTVPLGVAIPVGLRVKIDAATNYDWPSQVCDAQGCRAVAVVDAGMAAAFDGAEAAAVQFVPYGSRTGLSLPAPMDGYSEAVAKLKDEARKASRR